MKSISKSTKPLAADNPVGEMNVPKVEVTYEAVKAQQGIGNNH
ncbi:MAG: hypothetical protein ACK560_03435 [Bacteroidota bacterium]